MHLQYNLMQAQTKQLLSVEVIKSPERVSGMLITGTKEARRVKIKAPEA